MADPLRAADHAFLFERVVKAAAAAESVAATFMAKPFARQPGNGLHVHLSLVDQAGDNLFARDDRALGHAIAGLQATMAEAMLLFAPNANSFRRLCPGSYAPTAPSWGHNNRTVALRIPTGDAAARRIEHRVAGGDINPYLMLAVVLGAALDGIDRGAVPPEPVSGNAYEADLPRIPTTWADAIAAFRDSETIARLLPRQLIRNYVLTKEQELEADAELTEEERIGLYLDTV